MTGYGIILPEQTDDALVIPGLSDLTNSNAMADTVSVVTPPAYYPLQPLGRQNSTESISILNRVKSLNRTGSPEHSNGSFGIQQVASAKRTHEDTLYSSGSPLQKRKTNPDLLFVKLPKNSALIMQQQERQKRMQQQQRRRQDKLQQQQQQQQEDMVLQHPNLPPNTNKMLSHQDQSIHQPQQQQQLQHHQQPTSASAKHHMPRQHSNSAHSASHSQPVKSAPRLHSAQPSSRLARMSSDWDPAGQDTLHAGPSLLQVHLNLHALTLLAIADK